MKLILALLLLAGSTANAAPALHWSSDGLNNRDLTIHPNGNVLLTSLMSPKNLFSAIAVSTRVDGQWSDLAIAPFSGTFDDLEAMFDPAGEWLYFASKRPKPDRDGDDWDLWRVAYSDQGWGDPENLGTTINTDGDEFYPSLTRDGKLYFTATRNKNTREDIFVATQHQGQFALVKAVGSGVNSATWEFNSFIDPDERYLIFGSQRRDGEVGGGDLYISYRKDGVFEPAQLLKGTVNSKRLDYCPFVFEDTLFFASERAAELQKPLTMKQLQHVFSAPGNGMGDIYQITLDEVLP